MSNPFPTTSARPLNRRRFLGLAGAAASAAALAGCSDKPGGDAGAGGTEISMWNGTFNALGKGTDTTKAEGDYWLAQAVKQYQEQSGAKLKIDNTLEGPDLLTKLRTSGVARNGPDLATVWAGTYLLSVKDFLAPLDEFITPEMSAGVSGWESVTDGMVAGQGPILGIPCGTDKLTCLSYNTKLLDKAGVSVDSDTVQEWDDFVDMLDKIKSAGVTPLVWDQTSYLYFSLMYWIAQQVGGTPGVVELNSGKRAFSSPEVKLAVDQWLSLVPYVAKGAPVLTGDDSFQMFLNGKAAIASAGNLKDLRDKLGDEFTITKLPNASLDAPVRDSGIGGPGASFVISADSEHISETVDFVAFLNSEDQQIKRATMSEGPLPNLAGRKLSEIFSDPLEQKVAEWSSANFIFWPDNTLHADLIAEVAAKTQLVWNGKLSTSDYLEQLDEKRDQIVKDG